MSKTQVKTPAPAHIRWTIKRDVAQVAAIVTRAGGGWSQDDFLTVLARRDTIGMIAERGPQVVAHMLYRLCRGSLELVQFWAADKAAAAQMLEKFSYKAAGHRREVLAIPYRLVLGAAGATVCCPEDPGLNRVVLTGLPAGPVPETVCQLVAGGAAPEIAADALEEGGCEDEELLAVLRAGGSPAALIARQLVA